MDGEDLELFRRSLHHATEAHSGADLDEQLAELGWVEALGDERRAAVATLFELQGEANASSSALQLVLADALDRDVPVVLPALGGAAPAGVLDGGRLTVDGLTLTIAPRVLVVARAGGKDVVVPVDAHALGRRPVGGIDPWLGIVHVTGTVDLAAEPEPVSGWEGAVAVGRLAVAHELLGASRRMLELARQHALERVQFGQPIAGFQAVRHRLADTLVAVETAEALVDAAWEDGDPGTAAMAKALAGRGARVAARHCQQVLAGIGFTTEHDLHRYVRRTFLLDELLTPARTLTHDLGDQLLTTRGLPPLHPL